MKGSNMMYFKQQFLAHLGVKEEWTTMNLVMGEIRLLWAICQNCCITCMLHLCSCCNRRPSISHKFNRLNLNYGVPQWKANICKLAKGESHLLYTVKSHVYMAASKWMPVCSLYMLLIWDSVFPLSNAQSLDSLFSSYNHQVFSVKSKRRYVRIKRQ